MKVTKQEYLEIQKMADTDNELYLELPNFEKYIVARNISLQKYKSTTCLRALIYITNFFIPLDNDFIIADEQICNKDIKKLARFYNLYDLYQHEIYRDLVVYIIQNKRKQLRRYYDDYLETCEEIEKRGLENNGYVYKNGKRC